MRARGRLYEGPGNEGLNQRVGAARKCRRRRRLCQWGGKSVVVVVRVAKRNEPERDHRPGNSQEGDETWTQEQEARRGSARARARTTVMA